MRMDKRDIQTIELDLIAHGCNTELLDEYAAEVLREAAERADACLDRQGFKLGEYSLREYMTAAIMGDDKDASND